MSNGAAALYERNGSIVTVTLNRPREKNAISDELIADLELACERANRDLSVSCMILTATEGVFCAGGNIKDMQAKRGLFGLSAVQTRLGYQCGVQRIPLAFYDLHVPVIAAVNGPAMGAGLDLALMCDLRVASESATFGESFINVGLTAGDGGAWLLQRAVGRAIAFELTLTGDSISARQALEYGLVSRVVPAPELQATARSLAERIARHPPHSIRLNKRLLRESARTDLPTALEIAAGMQAIVQQTRDFGEAVEAVVGKRPGAFRGE